MKSRRDKIRFLTGLSRGERQLSEILPPDVIITIGNEKTTVQDKRTGKILNESQSAELFSSIRISDKITYNVSFYEEP